MVKEKGNFQKFMRFILTTTMVLGIIFVVYLRIENPDFNLFAVIFLIVIMASIVVFLWFGSNLLNKFKLKSSQVNQDQPVMSPQDARIMAEKVIGGKDYADKVGIIYDQGSELRGKNRKNEIYFFICNGKHEADKRYAFFVNLHYPRMWRFLINASDRRMEEVKNLIAQEPEDPADIITTVDEDELSGRRRTKIEQVRSKPELQNKEELK